MTDFIGIILGGDINSYAVSRAFYEKYKIKTIILGKYPIYPTKYSKITKCYYNQNILDEKVLFKELLKIDKLYPNKKKIILANTDYYVEELIRNKENILKLSSNFIIPTIDIDLFDKLFNKNSFYKLCSEYNIPHPKTIVIDLEKDNLNNIKIDFSYPVFLKPSNTDKYTRIKIPNRFKGYKANSKEEVINFLNNIKDYGYNDKFIIQEYIDANDDEMYVFTFYTNQDYKTEVCTAGKILMHDRSPELIGNYNAITNFYDKELSIKLKEFLEKIKFKGICHFDILYDHNRNKYMVLEINIRQGRSNLYTLLSGVNLMEYIVNDYIYNKRKNEFKIANKEFLVSMISKNKLSKVLNKPELKKINNFQRFTYTRYDLNIKTLLHQIKSDRKTIKCYLEYK